MAAMQFALLFFCAVITHHCTYGIKMNDPERKAVQLIADQVKEDFEKRTGLEGGNFEVYRLKKHGTTYVVDVHIPGNQNCRLQIETSGPGKPVLERSQCNKEGDEDTTYIKTD